jgi:8-oxo-dGTP pyrophosphatase MutT (NUDIX family)
MRVFIFYGESSVILTNDKTVDENDHKSLFLKGYDRRDYFDAVKKLTSGYFEHIIIRNENIDSLITEIKSQYQVIEAAGGIITNKKNETLMIFRRGKWDLPKGKIEPGESIETAAEREIEEETGVGNLKLLKKFNNTYHVYEEKGKEIFKITYWFHFSIEDNPILTPQLEEGITEIKWFSENDLSIPLSNTYESIKNLMSGFDLKI